MSDRAEEGSGEERLSWRQAPLSVWLFVGWMGAVLLVFALPGEEGARVLARRSMLRGDRYRDGFRVLGGA